MTGDATDHAAAITGLGLVTPLGTGVEDNWRALTAGHSGIGPITRFDPTGYPVRCAGEVDDPHLASLVPRARQRHMDRYALLGVAAAMKALQDASLVGSIDHRDRAAVVMGVGIGGLETLEKGCEALHQRGPRFVHPYFIPMLIPNMAAGWISMLTGIRGASLTVATACASGAHALGEALALIRRGQADVVLAGGSEAAVTPVGVAGFAAMRALSTREVDPPLASCPFDVQRDGFVIAEGAAVLVLESMRRARDRGARIHALVTGSGTSSDAHDLTQPDPEGRGALRAMREALRDAGLGPEHVDHVNAHATSTPLGDLAEARALRGLLGPGTDQVYVTSTKGATGHLLGAAGAVEAAFAALTLSNQLIPPTLNLTQPDPECGLRIVAGKPRPHHIRNALSNAFGFGGTNCTLVLSRNEEET